MIRALQRVSLLVGILLCLPASSTGEPPTGTALSGYFHRSWTEFDDVHLPSAIRAITQDEDGYIWVGFLDGLVRFDGARFIGWDALQRPPLPTRVVVSLEAGRDGSLWIGFGNLGGVARYKNGVLRNFQASEVLPAGAIRQLLEDHEGNIWAAGYSGLARFRDDKWERIEAEQGLPRGTVHLLSEDAHQTLWVGKPDGLYRREDGQTRFSRVGPPTAVLTAFGETSARAPWKDQVSLPFERFALTDPPPIVLDRRGQFWTSGSGGLLHVTAANQRGERTAIVVRPTNGLTSDHVVGAFEDRDGNVWIGTEAGLDMYAPQGSRQVMNIAALSQVRVTAVATDSKGHTWAGTPTGLYRQGPDGDRWFHKSDGLPADGIRALHVDSTGVLWVLTDRGIAKSATSRFQAVSAPANVSLDRVVSLTTAPDGTVWLCDIEGIIRWQGRVATRLNDASRYGRPNVVFTDSRGRVWVGFWDGGAVSIHDGRFTEYTASNGLARGRVTAIYEDRAGSVWVGTLGGFSRLNAQGQFESLPNSDPLSRIMVRAIIDDDRGRIWISALSGLVRFDRREFDTAVRNPAHRVPVTSTPESFERGVGGEGTPAAARTAAGLIWFAQRAGVAVVDPARLRQAPPPPVRIERVLADDRVVRLDAELILGARTSRVQIDYTSLTFASPGVTQFRYRLDGFDRDWVDARALRQAFYTNLPPRPYIFRVQASQDGGSWSDAPRPLAFSIAPAFYQTTTFYGFLVGATALLMWSAWQARLHRVRQQYSLVLAERARLGREIHDTLLQGMVGVALQIHGISETVPPESQSLKARLDRARDFLEHYIRETRVSIWDLRSQTLDTRDLPSAVREAGETITAGTGVRFAMTVHGAPVRRDSRVEEHLLRIAHEAMANAIRHAEPSSISTELSYENGRVRLRVRDDGHGFNPEDVTHKAGQRWGLTSMRERAQQIGAQFRCTSSRSGGTEIETIAPVPAN